MNRSQGRRGVAFGSYLQVLQAGSASVLGPYFLPTVFFFIWGGGRALRGLGILTIFKKQTKENKGQLALICVSIVVKVDPQASSIVNSTHGLTGLLLQLSEGHTILAPFYVRRGWRDLRRVKEGL